VLVTGGYGGGNLGTNAAELYNPATGTFAATGAMAFRRFQHTSTVLGSGKVLVAGGSNGSTPVASAELFDPSIVTTVTTGSGKHQQTTTTVGGFRPTGSMTATHSAGTEARLGSGNVLVAGGGNAVGDLYNPTTGTFSATGAMTSSRTNHTATLLDSGLVLVAGGAIGSTYLSSAELFDPASNTFSATASMPHAHSQHTASKLASGQVLVAGGLPVANEQLADRFTP